MNRLRQVAERFLKLDVNRVVNQILRNKEVQREIIRLNTQEQLFKKGIDRTGRTLESIGGAYSDLTVLIKSAKGQPTDRVTLRDTGDFYESFRIEIGKTEFEIQADTLKDDTDLIQEWGEDILGLTEESLEVIRDTFRDAIIEYIQKEVIN